MSTSAAALRSRARRVLRRRVRPRLFRRGQVVTRWWLRVAPTPRIRLRGARLLVRATAWFGSGWQNPVASVVVNELGRPDNLTSAPGEALRFAEALAAAHPGWTRSHSALADTRVRLGDADGALVPLADGRRALGASLVHDGALEPDEVGDHLPDGVPLKPAFAVVGPPKSGTSALQVWLEKHPSVLPAVAKEPKTWLLLPDLRPVYDAHFLTVRNPDRYRTGDCSPHNLKASTMPRQLLEVNPDLLFLTLVRDPTERAYSHYQMQSRSGRMTRSWSEVVDGVLAAYPRPPRHGDEIQGPGPVDGPRRAPSEDIILDGCVTAQLRRYVEQVPPERICVIRSETLFAEPARTMAEVYGFLGLEPFEGDDHSPVNAGVYRPQPGDEEASERLRAWFADDMASLDADLAALGVRTIGAFEPRV